MGNFICAVILLLTVIVFTAVNSYAVLDLCEDMLSYIENSNTSAAIDLWEKKEKYVSLFVRDAETDLINSAILTMSINGESEETVSGLIFAINELKENEQLSFLNLF